MELQPSGGLAGDEEKSQTERQIEPARRSPALGGFAAHEGGNLAARHFQRDAAGNNDQRVEIKDGRQGEVLPIRTRSLTNDQGAGEGGEGHGDRRQAYPDSGARRRWRGRLDAPQISASGTRISPAAVARALAR